VAVRARTGPATAGIVASRSPVRSRGCSRVYRGIPSAQPISSYRCRWEALPTSGCRPLPRCWSRCELQPVRCWISRTASWTGPIVSTSATSCHLTLVKRASKAPKAGLFPSGTRSGPSIVPTLRAWILRDRSFACLCSAALGSISPPCRRSGLGSSNSAKRASRGHLGSRRRAGRCNPVSGRAGASPDVPRGRHCRHTR
jgi:hypothetical protein